MTVRMYGSYLEVSLSLFLSLSKSFPGLWTGRVTGSGGLLVI